MKMKLLLILALSAILTSASGQLSNMWDKWNWLTGEWIGEGAGQPGQGSGTFSFSYDLDKNILVRRSHTEFPSSDNKPKTVHNDLMIIYPDQSGNPVKAIYFDNEGHTINYSITYSKGTTILTSEKAPNVPVFRLTYTSLETEAVNTKFEMSQDGVKFSVYLEGKSKKRN